MHPGVSSDFRVGDLVFVPINREFPGEGKCDYATRGRRTTGKTNVPLMTIHDANKEIRRLARLHPEGDTAWTADPTRVSRWMAPLGAVLGVDIVRGASKEGTRGVNVSVSRRAQVSNTFLTPPNGFPPSSTDIVGILYQNANVQVENDRTISVVQMTTVLVGGNDASDFDRVNVTFDASHDVPRNITFTYRDNVAATGVPTSTDPSSNLTFVYIGRVLHSPTRYPTPLECTKMCLSRDPNIRPSTIEIVLGNI